MINAYYVHLHETLNTSFSARIIQLPIVTNNNLRQFTIGSRVQLVFCLGQ